MLLEIDLEVGDALGKPLIKIMIDDYLVLYEGPAVPMFDREFELSSGYHELKIVHYGKKDSDHVYNMDGTIGIDKFVMINHVSIDSVSLKDKELQQGQFWPVYGLSYVETMQQNHSELPSFISPNLYLGHNGTWKWEFYYPFVDWIIAQRRPGPQLDNTIFKTSQATLDEAKNFFLNAGDL